MNTGDPQNVKAVDLYNFIRYLKFLIETSTMSKFIQLLVALVFIANASFAQQQSKTFIHFKSDRFDLNSDAKNSLDQLIKKSSTSADYTISIIGHTDQDGSLEYNEQLAKDRVQAVKAYLLYHKLDSKKINTIAKGERELIAKGEDDSSKSKNRRVEILLEYVQLENMEELLSQVNNGNDVQKHSIDPSIVNTLDLSKGSSVTIPANSLVFKDGSPATGKITITTKETFTYADFIAADLHSSSKGEILETGGMVYIQATQDNQELFFKEGSAMEVVYPEQEVKEGMQLFTGENIHDNEMDWVLDENDVRLQNPTLPFDLKHLLDYTLPEMEEPNISFSKMTSYPSLLRKPYDARLPKLPIKEKINLALTNGQKKFMSKKKKEARRDMLFKKKMKAYEKDLANYKDAHEKYLIKKEEYDQAKPLVAEAQNLWKKEMNRRLELIYDYKKKKTSYVHHTRMQNAINYVKKHYGKKAEGDIFKTFEKIYFGDIEVKKFKKEALHAMAFGKELQTVIDLKGLEGRHLDKNYFKGSNIEYFKLIGKIEAKEMEALYAKTGTIKAKNINKYVASVNQFGWINIDRFLKMDKEMLASVRIPNQNITTKYYCILKESRSILQPKYSKSGFSFNALPKGQAFKIIGIKLDQGKPQIAIREFSLNKNINISMEFRPVTLDEIKDEFAGLESYSM